MDDPGIAALPMYDFAGLTGAHDRLWAAIRERLDAAGVVDLPMQLAHDMPHEALWMHPRLLLGQACEYPLAKRYGSYVRVVATPRYEVPGCRGATYRSAILVRQDDPAQRLEDLRNRRCVINEPLSNSGMNLLRAAIAPLARGPSFFASVQASGAHRRSVDAVVAGSADVCAIDCVTMAHLRQQGIPGISELRVLDWTPTSPSLPYVTAATTTDRTLQALRSALEAVSEAPALRDVRRALFLDGFDPAPGDGFSEVLRLERAAVQSGYPMLN